MNVLVTGAGGFLGREVVSRASRAGHDVTALVRSIDHPAFEGSVRVIDGDLRYRHGWPERIGDPSVVVHAAAAPGGDRSTQLANTLVGTENLLGALVDTPIHRFVHISSFSVYDFGALRKGSLLDEHSPLETCPELRDGYTEAKLAQEQLVRHWCAERAIECIILRPGAIVGVGKPWGYGAAFSIGSLSFVVAPNAPFRVISLANCADAIVDAIRCRVETVETLNLVNDNLPTNRAYFRTCRSAGAPTGTMVPVPWSVLHAIGRALETLNGRYLAGRLRTPELLDRPRQDARWKPLDYTNGRAKAVLGWAPRESLAETIDQLVGLQSEDGP